MTKPIYQNGDHLVYYPNEMRVALRLIAARDEGGLNYYESVSFSAGSKFYMLGLFDDGNSADLIVSPTASDLLYRDWHEANRYFVQTREHTHDLSVPLADNENIRIIEFAHRIFCEIKKVLEEVAPVYRSNRRKYSDSDNGCDELFDKLFPMMESASVL